MEKLSFVVMAVQYRYGLENRNKIYKEKDL